MRTYFEQKYVRYVPDTFKGKSDSDVYVHNTYVYVVLRTKSYAYVRIRTATLFSRPCGWAAGHRTGEPGTLWMFNHAQGTADTHIWAETPRKRSYSPLHMPTTHCRRPKTTFPPQGCPRRAPLRAQHCPGPGQDPWHSRRAKNGPHGPRRASPGIRIASRARMYAYICVRTWTYPYEAHISVHNLLVYSRISV